MLVHCVAVLSCYPVVQQQHSRGGPVGLPSTLHLSGFRHAGGEPPECCIGRDYSELCAWWGSDDCMYV